MSFGYCALIIACVTDTDQTRLQKVLNRPSEQAASSKPGAVQCVLHATVGEKNDVTYQVLWDKECKTTCQPLVLLWAGIMQGQKRPQTSATSWIASCCCR